MRFDALQSVSDAVVMTASASSLAAGDNSPCVALRLGGATVAFAPSSTSTFARFGRWRLTFAQRSPRSLWAYSSAVRAARIVSPAITVSLARC